MKLSNKNEYIKERKKGRIKEREFEKQNEDMKIDKYE